MGIVPTETVERSTTLSPTPGDPDSEDLDTSPAASAEKIRRLEVWTLDLSSDDRMNSEPSKGRSKLNPRRNLLKVLFSIWRAQVPCSKNEELSWIWQFDHMHPRIIALYYASCCYAGRFIRLNLVWRGLSISGGECFTICRIDQMEIYELMQVSLVHI